AERHVDVVVAGLQRTGDRARPFSRVLGDHVAKERAGRDAAARRAELLNGRDQWGRRAIWIGRARPKPNLYGSPPADLPGDMRKLCRKLIAAPDGDHQ